MRISIFYLLLILIVLGSCESVSNSKESPLYLDPEVTIDDLHNGYRNGDFSVRDVVDFYLRRIDSIDQNGVNLNAVITINPRVREQAQSLDKMEFSGPLYGIPILLKDNIDTGDSMPNTAGSIVMKDAYPNADAPLVQQLKEAGAIILGKTNLSEWANFHSNVSSSGWSGLGGQTKNPYRLNHNPCGSSAGSGVAVAANLCVVAIGTETNGSIVCPSNNNGIVGIKPTVGLISRTGIIPISDHHDTAGPMARTVRDAVLTLSSMTGLDEADKATQQDERSIEEDYTQFLRTDGISGKRIGFYLKPLAEDSSELTLIMNQAIQELKEAGAEIIEIEEILHPRTEYLSFTVMQYEFKDGVNQYLRGLAEKSPVANLGEIIDQTFKDSVEMQFDHQLLKRSNERGDLSSKEYRSALDSIVLTSRKEGIDRVMDQFNLDAIVAPTGGPAWKTDHENGDAYDIYSSSPAAISGYPNITVPMGFIDELPVGMSIFGRPWTEGKLIEIAYDFEQRTNHRKSPKYLD
ncbi:amidase [Portibacter marinus]|uniref:amidase n=1 Tax=Portibacter marinus TaxID=2898660 RepID=UPI001F3E0E2E|nr:amidase [Portibacter marinus]